MYIAAICVAEQCAEVLRELLTISWFEFRFLNYSQKYIKKTAFDVVSEVSVSVCLEVPFSLFLTTTKWSPVIHNMYAHHLRAD